MNLRRGLLGAVGATAVVLGSTVASISLAGPAAAASNCGVDRTAYNNGSATCLNGPGQVRVKLDCYDNVHSSHSFQYGPWVNAPGKSSHTCAAGYGGTDYPGGVFIQTR